MNKIYADKPCGNLYIFHTFEDVAQFLEACRYSPYDLKSFGCKWNPDPDRDVLVDYVTWGDGEPEMIDDTEGFFPGDVDCVSYHDVNKYFTGEGDDIEPGRIDSEGVRASEVVFDLDIWDASMFPYVAYLNQQSGFDRAGGYEVDIVVIKPLSQLYTTKALTDHLQSDYAARQIEKREMYNKMSRIASLKRKQELDADEAAECSILMKEIGWEE